ncbi:MAG: ABC transporter permease, partial [Planctomycetota bacterium]
MTPGVPFQWLAAVRFLREGRLQSAFIVIGVAIGVGVSVFMSALLGGLQANLFHRVMSSQPHITIDRPRQVAVPQRESTFGVEVLATMQLPSQRMNSLDQWQKVRDQLRQRADVVAVSPTASGPAFVIRGEATQAIQLVGIDPEQYARIVPLPEKMVAGTFRMTNSDMIVGMQFAEDLGVEVGDKLRVANVTGTRLTLNIVGIFDLGSRGANKRTAYVLLSTAQNLLDLVGGVSGIDITAVDPYAAELVARSISAQTGMEAISWIAANNQFFSSLKAQEFSSILIRLFVGLSVAAGIASVLVVSVVQRQKDIGILRAMGGSRRQIMGVFLIQGAIVGLLGSLAGSAFGAGLLQVWSLPRMVDTAAWLCDAVLPEVPVRQWVLSLPYRVRALCAYDAAACALVRS